MDLKAVVQVYMTAVDALFDTLGWQITAMNALMVLLVHVVKCFSIANPNQQVSAWESKLRRILTLCL